MKSVRVMYLGSIALLLCLTISVSAFAEILIGVVGPMTGKVEWMGEQMDVGAQQAVDDLNAVGGVLGQPVKLITVDDACDVKQANAAARKMVNDKVVLVVGHLCSSTSIAASPTYTKNDILVISPASTATKFTDEGGKNIFRVIGRDDQQGKVAARYLSKKWGNHRIAVVHDRGTYGEGLARSTKQNLNQANIKEVFFGGFDSASGDYSQIVQALKKARIDVAFISGYIEDISTLLHRANDQGVRFKLVSGDTLSGEAFWLTAGKIGQGARFTFTPDARNNSEATAVIKTFRKRDFEPDGYTLNSYAAVQVWAQAVRKAKSLQLDKVIDVMHKIKFNTVLGNIGFDEKGDMTGVQSWAWYEWNNGKIETVR